MHPQLKEIAGEFEQAQQRLNQLGSRLPDDLWPVRPAPARWSVSECVAHLNLTARAFLPVLDAGLEQARAHGGTPPRHYRRDPVGWLLWLGTAPPARVRTRTAASFVPSHPDRPHVLRATFAALQAEQLARIRAADGLPLQTVKIVSPFDRRVRYNLFSALGILARHQHRHLWQAEQAAQTVLDRGGATPPAD